MAKRPLKVLDQAFTPLHPSIGTLSDPSCRDRNKSCFALCYFLSFGGLWSQLKANLGHDLRVECLECFRDCIEMIAMVKEERNFRNVDGFGAKVVQVVAEHLNQALVFTHVGFGAVRKERQS